MTGAVPTRDANDGAALFKLFTARRFFDAPTCSRLIVELDAAPAAPATVYGRADSDVVDERTRKVARITPSPDTNDFVRRRLIEARQEIGAHFGVELQGCEAPQFLRYAEGGFFVAHQDGGTPLLRSQAEQSRKASVVIFLNASSHDDTPGTHGGGALVFTEWRPDRPAGRFELRAETGSLVAFLPDTTHEVTPVTRGVRYSIASWYF